MITPVTQMCLAFMKERLQINVWSEEVPRYDVNGLPINPQATQTPSAWPVVTCQMAGKFKRNWNCGVDAYDDYGPIKIEVWGTVKTEVQTTYSAVEEFWAREANWAQASFTPSGSPVNQFYLISMMLGEHQIGQEENVRLAKTLLCFRGEIGYDCRVHGAVNTQN